MFTWKHTQQGVNLHMKNQVKEIIKNEAGDVTGVILRDESRIECQMVLFGLGIEPATKFLERTESGIKLDQHGAIVCDPFL
jgi:NAD(P)H-nitrite reductase large subunit